MPLEKKARIASAFRQMDATPSEFDFDFNGVQTWRANASSKHSKSNQPGLQTWRVHAN
jgi:hypothetical protein